MAKPKVAQLPSRPANLGNAVPSAAPADEDPGHQLRARRRPALRAAGHPAGSWIPRIHGCGWPTGGRCDPHLAPPGRRFPGLRRNLDRYAFLYEALASAYGVQPAEAVETIETVPADPKDSRRPGVDVGMPLLLVSRQAFDVSGEPVERAQSSTGATATSWSCGCTASLLRWWLTPSAAADRAGG